MINPTVETRVPHSQRNDKSNSFQNPSSFVELLYHRYCPDHVKHLQLLIKFLNARPIHVIGSNEREKLAAWNSNYVSPYETFVLQVNLKLKPIFRFFACPHQGFG